MIDLASVIFVSVPGSVGMGKARRCLIMSLLSQEGPFELECESLSLSRDRSPKVGRLAEGGKITNHKAILSGLAAS